MIEAYKDYWKRYAVFRGRSTRKQFFLGIAANMLIFFMFIFLFIFSEDLWFILPYGVANFLSGCITFLVFIYGLAMIIPNFSLTVRRLRDGGCSPYCVLLECIPFLGSIILLVLLCTPSIQNESEEITTQ